MAFESWREINRIRKNHRDAIYFYANLQDRFYTIEENDILPDELNPDDKNLNIKYLSGENIFNPAECAICIDRLSREQKSRSRWMIWRHGCILRPDSGRKF